MPTASDGKLLRDLIHDADTLYYDLDRGSSSSARWASTPRTRAVRERRSFQYRCFGPLVSG
jgi:hypothetical protein